MRHYILVAAAGIFLTLNPVNAQTTTGNSYLSGTFNFTSYDLSVAWISEQAGYHYYLTDNLSIGGIFNTYISLSGWEPFRIGSCSFSIGPSLKYHILKVNWLFMEPACLLTFNPGDGKVDLQPWGTLSLGVDIPINHNVFLEIASTGQITAHKIATGKRKIFWNSLLDIGFMVCLNRPKEKIP